MIDAGYCVQMARYNAWQNKQLKQAMGQLDPKDLTRDRGAFFGSILATANHLLWGDLLWMSRFDGGIAPEGDIPTGVTLCATLPAWELARFRADSRILTWAEALHSVDLTGELTWYSGALGCEVSRSRSLCIVHMFNHQTHHRGQIHAMLTAAGSKAPVSDLAFMPEEGPWL